MTHDKTFELPRIAITMGDPAGIGPETIVRAWQTLAERAICRPLVIGHPEIFARAARQFAPELEIRPIDDPHQAIAERNIVPCLATGTDDVVRITPGVIDERGGKAAYDALVAAAHLALAGKIDALTTAPLHKGALHLAGHHYPGHTELLAELCGVERFAMMLYLGPGAQVRGPNGLAIVHVTLHMAMREALNAIQTPAILTKIHLVDDIMRRLSGVKPRIGVCALNPHAGEDGLFGDEEASIIRPAVEAAIREGISAAGPFPADTLIARACHGEFDAVVAMYHDQGHIAIKLLAMHQAVNVTLGLPIVRTSVAHGTAFDLAWTGRAETSGLIEAVRVAAQLSTPAIQPSH
jgi:4-phospho-D-threonate 3-dehydrogenase / 4-phospho-D-erythronate 3-dehydrogenase